MKHLEITQEIIEETCTGVHETFTNMLSLKPRPRAYRIVESFTSDADISGFVHLKDEYIEGTLMVSFPQQTIFNMLKAIYFKDFTEFDKSVKSGVGELTNVVFGIFKKNLNKNGFNFKMCIPNVITGPQHSVEAITPNKTLVVPFETDAGNFTVTVTVFKDATALHDEEETLRKAGA